MYSFIGFIVFFLANALTAPTTGRSSHLDPGQSPHKDEYNILYVHLSRFYLGMATKSHQCSAGLLLPLPRDDLLGPTPILSAGSSLCIYLSIYINLRRSRDCSLVTAVRVVRHSSVWSLVIHSVRFVQLLRCARKGTTPHDEYNLFATSLFDRWQ